MFRIYAILIGYAFGLFQTGYIIGRLKGIDIREHGSGNSGTSNANRVLGSKAGALVFVGDIVKTVLAFLVAVLLFYEGTIGYVRPGMYAGLGAVLGHNFPFYLKFKGGKGIACTLAIILMVDWRIALITFTIGFLLILVFRYTSLASLTMVSLGAVLILVFGYHWEAIAISFGLAVLGCILHHENIGRLISGTERKFSIKN